MRASDSPATAFRADRACHASSPRRARLVARAVEDGLELPRGHKHRAQTPENGGAYERSTFTIASTVISFQIAIVIAIASMRFPAVGPPMICAPTMRRVARSAIARTRIK